MLYYYAMATIVFAAIGAFAVIVRAYPIVNALGRPDTPAARFSAVFVGLLFGTSFALHVAGLTLLGMSPLTFTWPIALAYFAATAPPEVV